MGPYPSYRFGYTMSPRLFGAFSRAFRPFGLSRYADNISGGQNSSQVIEAAAFKQFTSALRAYSLSRLEALYLFHLSRGKTVSEIASCLGVHKSTASTHRERAYAKLGVSCMDDARTLIAKRLEAAKDDAAQATYEVGRLGRIPTLLRELLAGCLFCFALYILLAIVSGSINTSLGVQGEPGYRLGSFLGSIIPLGFTHRKSSLKTTWHFEAGIAVCTLASLILLGNAIPQSGLLYLRTNTHIAILFRVIFFASISSLSIYLISFIDPEQISFAFFGGIFISGAPLVLASSFSFNGKSLLYIVLCICFIVSLLVSRTQAAILIQDQHPAQEDMPGPFDLSFIFIAGICAGLVLAHPPHATLIALSLPILFVSSLALVFANRARLPTHVLVPLFTGITIFHIACLSLNLQAFSKPYIYNAKVFFDTLLVCNILCSLFYYFHFYRGPRMRILSCLLSALLLGRHVSDFFGSLRFLHLPTCSFAVAMLFPLLACCLLSFRALNIERHQRARSAFMLNSHLKRCKLAIGLAPRMQELTSSEKKIASAIGSGKSAAEAARELCLSKSTVSSHLSRIYRKLGIHSKEELEEIVRQEEAMYLKRL